jgi:hypothetical protein
MKKLSFNLLIILASFAFLTSCKQDLNITPDVQQTVNNDNPKEKYKDIISNIQGITNEDGILKFKDLKTYKQYLEAILNCTEEDYQNFCEKMNLQSLDNIMNEYTKESEKENAEIAQLNIKYGNWITVEKDIPTLKTSGAALSRILNQEGFYKIGDVLYFYNEQGEAISLKGDKAKLIAFSSENAIASIPKNDDHQGLFFIKSIKTKLLTRGNCGGAYNGPWVYNSTNDRKAYVNLNMGQNAIIDSQVFNYTTNQWVVTYNVSALGSGGCSASKKRFGGWTSYDTEWGSTHEFTIFSPNGSFPSPTVSMSDSDSPGASFIFDINLAIFSNTSTIPNVYFSNINITYWNRGGVGINYSCL